MTCKHYTADEEKYILSARRAGVSFEQIAKTLKRNKTALYQKFYDLEKKHGLYILEENPSEPVQESPTPDKTLEDFSPRDILKHLFKLGYRVDDKGIYVMAKQYVNLRSIINE